MNLKQWKGKQYIKGDVMEKLGPTGKFPRGKMNESDEGELKISIGKNKEGKIILKFGTPVTWIDLDPEDAIAIGQSLIEKALA